MKIAVTSQNYRTVTPHAGRTRRFLVYEAAEGGEPVEVDRLDLPKALSMREFHGKGPHPLDAVDVIIAGSFGEGFAVRMKRGGIIAVATDLTDPVEAVKEYLGQSGTEAPAQAACGCEHGRGHAHRHAHAHAHRYGRAHGSSARAGCIGTAASSVPLSRRGRRPMTDRLDIGAVASLKIDVLTETGWFDDARFKQNMADYGGSDQTQYRIAWDAENAGGFAALLTVTLFDGDRRKILLDTGWNTEWMNYVFARHGVDAMLERGEIDFMVLSHWHLDHFWGIESTLKHNPQLRLYAPATWRPEDWVLLKEKGNIQVEDHDGRSISICKNDVPHEGDLILTETQGEDGSGIYRLLPGVALRMFDASMLLQVRGENVLYVNVLDKGIVTVTGCGHPGIMTLLGFANETLAAPGLYGCYGGLHLSIFDTWKPEFDRIIDDVKLLGMEKMGCNHCTGWMWAEKAAAHGVPIIKGTDAYLSYPKRSAQARGSHAFLGNGDSVTF